MRKVWAFVKRDALIASSYRTAFAIQLASTLLWVPICYFVGKGLALGDSPGLARYGGDYFAYILIGIGLLGYFTVSLRTFNQSVRDSQLMGTLEIVLLSPTSIAELLFYSSAWIYGFATLRFALYLAFGSLFGLDLRGGDPLSAAAVLILAVPAFASLGIASAALILVIKRGESINLALTTGSLLLAGVMFPTDLLPGWLQQLSKLLPLTHALEGMRLALFQGYSPRQLAPQLGWLALFSVVCLPLALGLFALAVRWTKATGTLSHY